MNEWCRCRFCEWFKEYIGCAISSCSNYDKYKPNKAEIIEKARETNMSITDVVTLITME